MLMIASLGTLAYAVLNFVRAAESSRIQAGGRVAARVVGVTDVLNGGFTVHASYIVAGRNYIESFDVSTHASAPPANLVVAYDPGDPAHAELPGQPKFSSGAGFGFLAFSVVLLLGTLWLSDALSSLRNRLTRQRPTAQCRLSPPRAAGPLPKISEDP